MNTVDISSALDSIFGFMGDILYQFFSVSISVYNYTVPLFYFIFGGLLLSALVAYITKAVAKG